MSYLSPQTLTAAEQSRILEPTASHPRDHTVISVALGTGLRLAEIVGLDVGDVYRDDATVRTRLGLIPCAGATRRGLPLPVTTLRSVLGYRNIRLMGSGTTQSR